MAYYDYMERMIFEAPEGLLQRILMRLRFEERYLRLAKRNLAVFGMIAAGSIATFISAYREIAADMASSGLSGFLSLATSDTAIIVVLWREFAFSVLESLPIISIGATLAILLASLASLRMIATSFGKFMDHRLINV